MADPTFDRDGLARLDRAMAAHARGDGPPGLVWLVARHGVVHTGAAGSLDGAAGRPIAEDTIFRISSMTKPVTAVAALLLVEEGRLGLDDPGGGGGGAGDSGDGDGCLAAISVTGSPHVPSPVRRTCPATRPPGRGTTCLRDAAASPRIAARSCERVTERHHLPWSGADRHRRPVASARVAGAGPCRLAGPR